MLHVVAHLPPPPPSLLAILCAPPPILPAFFYFCCAMYAESGRDFEYRKRLAVILPTLTQIDATAVARR